MGHLGRLKAEYRGLAERLGRGTVALVEPEEAQAFRGFSEILEILFTPEEARLAARMPLRPVALSRLSKRLEMPEGLLQQKLEPMCDKGVVMDLVDPRTGRTSYLLAPPVIGFFEFSLMRARDGIPKKRMAEALQAYTHGDEAFAREAFGKGTALGRAVVHETALAAEPAPDVLDYERASSLLRDARHLAVSLCYCRHKAEHLGQACGAPVEICLSLDGGAEFVLRRRFGRPIERGEALEILASAREAGLAQVADNVMSRPAFLCNCCGCCCELMRGARSYGPLAVNPSGLLPRRDARLCAGCSRCARACPVSAIAMRPERRAGSARATLVPEVATDVCLGCGVCAGACRKGALRMERGPRRPRVPKNAVEKAVRMALERNLLPELLVDEGGGLGSRFLLLALRALTRLPPAQRLLASEQVRSRFVRSALARFRDYA
ncbi:MAG TPA: 4Fe-4S dicluster domain-containing protein [Anaeromyxobacteraceae bacterium]|nr:4Fe-4S dicluster domain-containing protein [Anaeromyxobacteraceae bacterium]